MKKILIIGAGAMGSAFTVPCVDNNNEVTLVGTHLENQLIASIKKNKNYHPSLKTSLSSKLNIERFENLKTLIEKGADIINLNVIRPKVLETTALGAAFLAGYQIGEFKSLNEIQIKWKKDRVFSPKLNKSLRNNLLQGWKVAIRKTLA